MFPRCHTYEIIHFLNLTKSILYLKKRKTLQHRNKNNISSNEVKKITVLI